MTVRPYRPSDRARCLDVFDGNIPTSFDLDEREEFEAYLDDLPGPYFVLLDGHGRVRGCGGWARAAGSDAADLCWGMIDRTYQGRGLGRRLTVARIEDAAGAEGVERIRLQTSQDTEGFYRRLGFEVIEREIDGFRPGFDRVEMERDLRRPLRPGSGDGSLGAPPATR